MDIDTDKRNAFLLRLTDDERDIIHKELLRLVYGYNIQTEVSMQAAGAQVNLIKHFAYSCRYPLKRHDDGEFYLQLPERKKTNDRPSKRSTRSN